MNNTKHTPGPWRLTHSTPSRGSSHKYVIWAEMPYHVSQLREGKSTPIGSIDMNEFYGHRWQFPTDADGEMIKDASFNRSEIDAEANAKLIASAPELLEALKELIKCCKIGLPMLPSTYSKYEELIQRIENQ